MANPEQTGGVETACVRRVGIVGLGAYTPERVLSNADLEKMVDTSDQWIVERTGIRTFPLNDADYAAPRETAARILKELGF